MADNSSDKMIYNYVVAYLDILGQKENLKQFPKVLYEVTNLNSLIPRLEETYVKTQKIRNTIRDYINGVEDQQAKRRGHESFYDNLSDEQRKNIEGMSSPIEFRYFGDSITVYSKLTSAAGKLSVTSIYTIIAGVAINMLMGFSNHIVLRGGIEIGIAVDWEDFGIYGSALYGAYELESNIADHPRIVLGDELIDYLSFWKKCEGIDFVSKLNKQLANQCFSIIGKDGDGRPILDFLSDNMLSMVEQTDKDTIFNNLQPKVAEGFRFVMQEYERFGQEKNSKLFRRYKLLSDYYLARLDNWGLKK